MKTMGAARFKERCLALLDAVDSDGITITKRGRPVARLLPASTESSALIGSLRGRIRIKGNILSTGLRWDAES